MTEPSTDDFTIEVYPYATVNDVTYFKADLVRIDGRQITVPDAFPTERKAINAAKRHLATLTPADWRTA